MCSQRLSGTVLLLVQLLLVQLLLVSMCLVSSAVPIGISNPPNTNVRTEGIADSRIEQPPGAIPRSESTQFVIHTNKESSGAETHGARQEALPSDIKNFVPQTLSDEVHPDARIAHTQGEDHGPKIHPGAGNPQNYGERELKEYGTTDATSAFEKVQSNTIDLPEQIQKKVKAVLKNDKSKRLSIFSVLHPALAAALTSEKVPEHSDIPRAPLNDVDYTTGPLKGTESHDRDALQYARTVSSKQAILAQIQEAVPRAQESKGVKHAARGFGFARSKGTEEDELRNRKDQERVPVENAKRTTDTNNHLQSQYIEHDQEASNPNGRNQARDIHAQEHFEGHLNVPKPGTYAVPDRGSSGQISEHSENSSLSLENPSTMSPHSKASLNITVVQEPSGMGMIMKTTAKYWHGLVNSVKRVAEALKPPKSSPSQTPESKLKDDFTEDDVQDMVNEIVRDLQRRNKEGEEGISSSTNSKRSNRVSTGGLEEDFNDERKRDRLLMLRTKTLVSPDAVADAVTSAAKRMLSKRGDSISRETSSRFLREVQDKMEELLQPME